MQNHDTLAVRTLLTMGHQRLGLEEALGRAVFNLAAAGAAIGAAFQRALVRHQLTGLQFDLLVVLYALEPRVVAPADLAHYTGCKRSSVSAALGELCTRHWVAAQRSLEDRRSFDLSLTDAGRQVTDAAVADYLGVLSQLAQDLSRQQPAPKAGIPTANPTLSASRPS